MKEENKILRDTKKFVSADTTHEFVFSYGTLMITHIQEHLLGRRCNMLATSIKGFKMGNVTIGTQTFKCLDEDATIQEEINGKVLVVSSEELSIFDDYEGSDYKRVRTVTTIGIPAWVYVRNNNGTTNKV